jgi:hypothetical protein
VTPEPWLLLVGVLVLLVLTWTVWTLTRLGRLETRVARAWTALDSQLQRRAGLAEELARHHPAAVGAERAAYLAAFAADARRPGDGDRELAENALRSDLAGTTTRVALARRFYNDAVRDTHALRRSRLTRLLRLHASRPLPRFFDIEVSLDSRHPRPDSVGKPGR